MATEKEYDEIIEPMLLDVANKCKELGMSIIARVEWEPGESGITQVEPKFSAGQKLVFYAAHSQGNVDKMCLSLQKNEDCRQSIFLNKGGRIF